MQQEGELAEKSCCLFVLPCLDELIDTLGKTANAVRFPFLRSSFGAGSKVIRQPPVWLPTVLGRFHEMLLHPFGHLAVVERQHVGTGSGPLREVRRKVKAEPRPDRNGNARRAGGQFMAGLLGGLIERRLVFGVGKQDFQDFVLRQPMPGRGEIAQHAFHQQPTVVRRLAKSFDELTKNLGHALAQLGCRIVGAPEPGLLEQQLEINRLATFSGFQALPDAFSLLPADRAPRLGQPAIKQERSGFVLREGVQIDDVLRRELASREFGERLAGRITLARSDRQDTTSFTWPGKCPVGIQFSSLRCPHRKADPRRLEIGSAVAPAWQTGNVPVIPRSMP